jgi:AbrB family looped-hinge helix DNA binding protein
MASAAVTSKGQITIPAKVREDLGLKAGSRVSFIKGENGEYILKPKDGLVQPKATLVLKPKTGKTGSIMDMEGCIHWTGKPVTIEEMNETIAKGWAGLLTIED